MMSFVEARVAVPWLARSRARCSRYTQRVTCCVEQVETPNVDGDGTTSVKFGSIEVPYQVGERLRQRGVLSPTPIQNVAMQRLLHGESVVLHAETGSGKTLAYLLPILARMLSGGAEEKCVHLVVLPSRELALQVFAEARDLSGPIRDRVQLMDGTEFPRAGTLIVGTAKSVQALSEKYQFTGFLQPFCTVVLDEVDRLLGSVGKYAPRDVKMRRQKHQKPAVGLLKRIAAYKERRIQIVAASATVGRALKRELASALDIPPKESFPVIRAESEGADRENAMLVGIPQNIRHFYIPIIQDELSELLDGLVEALITFAPKKPIVFVNKGERIKDVIHELNSRGWSEAIALHEAFGYTGEAKEEEVLQRYESLLASFNSRHAENPPLLVASELSARGLHISNVDYVFLVDCPEDQNEYQHLAGRTGRMGLPGNVVSICTYRKARVIRSWQSQLGIEFEVKKLSGLS
mmetsp:Transcript_359/g.1204  ORF Transcript_359/g.1204 Transcript_359/m.1204 type:complete len:464 (-) Transcript_359:801-2192(-)|eukprot:CAMPEP_0198732620 /NCGR_PEP_ID=MMETSP1475-20131203/37406_1 /TAXON_ID= ORGANISM="Unidentified sp., Strain CCMP1999" /NCGR_SAMPLE_ID=MMETSP1475 /ASSEMBLY_ACC=CAM_ASM_001111 /LENGTH=463 /DNA_ID=CAMNT_0044495763 /DNA_START=50 /DNA_END=1441 /DNA_ORIENTATION=-